MKCRDCDYFYSSFDGCMYSTDPDKEACEIVKPREEDRDGDEGN